MALDSMTNYGPVFGDLLRSALVMPLGPGRPITQHIVGLRAMTVEGAFDGHTIANGDMALSCISAVWLYHNYLDESHEISQSIDTPTGALLHGIMHRREPDYGNAKYWFRRVGSHPIFGELAEAAALLAERRPDRDAGLPAMNDGWDPFAFVDLVEACEQGDNAADDLCQQIQMREWWLLFDHCFNAAVGR